MSSLDARYIQHLRQNAKGRSVHVCPLCKQRVSFASSDAFMQHINETHAEEADNKSPADLQVWIESLQSRANSEAYVEIDSPGLC
jgi:hypothetical protein